MLEHIRKPAETNSDTPYIQLQKEAQATKSDTHRNKMMNGLKSKKSPCKNR